MPEVSALPHAMRNKLEQLQAVDAPAPAPAAPELPQPAPELPQPAPEPERVTLSREEVNDLRAAADAARAATARLEEAEERNAALSARLTDLEASNKGKPVDPPPPAEPELAVTAEVTFTEDEIKEYGDSRAFIEKVVVQKVGEILNPLLSKINGSLAETRTITSNVHTTLERQQHDAFAAALAKEAPNFRTLIRHKDWPAFLQEVDGLSGFRMEELLSKHIADKNAVQAGKIYKAFEEKHTPATPTPEGAYAGAAIGAGAANLPPQPQAAQKLKISDRRKANKDYVDKKISWEKLQEISKAFEAAEKAGNIDYNS